MAAEKAFEEEERFDPSEAFARTGGSRGPCFGQGVRRTFASLGVRFVKKSEARRKRPVGEAVDKIAGSTALRAALKASAVALLASAALWGAGNAWASLRGEEPSKSPSEQALDPVEALKTREAATKIVEAFERRDAAEFSALAGALPQEARARCLALLASGGPWSFSEAKASRTGSDGSIQELKAPRQGKIPLLFAFRKDVRTGKLLFADLRSDVR